MTLTKRQKELVDYLRSYIAEFGYAPTLEEIGAHFSLASLATVHKHLSNLEGKGMIRRTWNHSRAIELVEPRAMARAVELPLLGSVAAGAPIEEINQADTISVPEELVRQNDTFVLRVAGDSMIEDGILNGDYIVVEHRSSADNGETVVAVVDGDTTVKKFFREPGGEVRLQPANERLEPIIVSQSDLQLRGVVVAVMRKY